MTKFDAAGTKLWERQLPSALDGGAIAVDDPGNIYVTGSTSATLQGAAETSAGADDVFIAKYDTNGDKQWIEQLGSPKEDGPTSTGVDGSGIIYVTGPTAGTLQGSPEETVRRCE